MEPYPSFFQNATGCTNYFNYLTCQVLTNTGRPQSCLCDFSEQKYLNFIQKYSYYSKLSLHNPLHLCWVFLCTTTGAWRPGVLLTVCDSPTGATCHSCGEPDVPWRLKGGEAPSAGRHEEHQAVAGGADGQLQGEEVLGIIHWSCTMFATLSEENPFISSMMVFSHLVNFFIHPGLNLQRSAGCNCRSPVDREVPAHCQLDRGGRVQNSPSLPLEGSAQRHRGGRLRKTSGRVLPGEQIWTTVETMWRVPLELFILQSVLSSHAGHHPGRRTHSALRPTSEVLWHDWQIPFNTGLGMKRSGADQSTSTLESSLLIIDSWFERQCKSAHCWIWTHLCCWFTYFF